MHCSPTPNPDKSTQTKLQHILAHFMLEFLQWIIGIITTIITGKIQSFKMVVASLNHYIRIISC